MTRKYLEFNSVYSLAEHFDNLQKNLQFPQYRPSPKREEYESNKLWGVALDEYEEGKSKDREIKRKYNEDSGKIRNEFKENLLRHLGLTKHKKAQKLWEMAWDSGHSYGYAEVGMEAEKLSELLLD